MSVKNAGMNSRDSFWVPITRGDGLDSTSQSAYPDIERSAFEPTWSVRCAGLTRMGTRENHEDAVVVLGAAALASGSEIRAHNVLPASAWVLCAVVDGMGGHMGGEYAAGIAAMDLARLDLADKSEAALTAVLETISDRIGAAGRAWELPAMGATTALIVAGGERAVIANVGDCRCYQVANGYVSQVSVDDRDPTLSENIVTQSLGGTPRVLDIHWLELAHADLRQTRYMLCSDGVHGVIDQKKMRAILLDEEETYTTAQRLVDAVHDLSRDNYSVVVMDVRPITDLSVAQ